MSDRLQGKTVIVVGAGQTPGETIGNGKATALLCAEQGAVVFCVDRILERAQSTAAEIIASGGSAFSGRADITNAPDVVAMLNEAHAALGHIDIVVNNVGIGMKGDGPAHIADEEVFAKTFDVNFTGTWSVIKAVLPVMRSQRHGSIINISSLASLAGATQLAYEVSKAAVNRLTLNTALSNAKYGIRCNAVLPGLMDTPMAVGGIAENTGQTVEATRTARSARVPLNGKMGTAWDTAHAVLFLASDDAKFITGVLLPVDGGMSARVG
jgi:NAD(P)-dependent dehydrogenase (short-subunit alcohol dehydrogenase family)